MSLIMKHIHHIVPKHMGGSNDPSNLIELTIEEHSRAHYVLWNQHGKEEDRIAWLSLSRQINTDEARRLTVILSNKRRQVSQQTRQKMSRSHLGHSVSQHTKDKIRKTNTGRKMPDSFSQKVSLGLTGRKLSESHKENISKSLKGQGSWSKGISCNAGIENPMFGKMWITNGIDSHRINKNDSIPVGYRKGRIMKSST
jgi:hypothetical protein